MKRRLLPLLLFVLLLLTGYLALTFWRTYGDPRSAPFRQWAQGNSATREALIVAEREACPGAPFILPADGFIGLLYGDPRAPYSANAPHQGIDIFSNDDPGRVPVYAAYDGYVTRESSWKSSLIIRIPDDPLQPGREIWLYYTHMADREGNDFIVDAIPAGTREQFVQQGTLLGYTGDYNGNSARTIWVHLHFSIVLGNNRGGYLNELEFANTIDPSPYLMRPVNYTCLPSPTSCTPDPLCPAGAGS